MNELISIIIPVYKVEKYINRCIESVVKQSYKNLEIILIDDGSPDGCPQVCDCWAEKDERVIVIHKDNGGLSSARNEGIRRACGKYLMFVDSDDCIDQYACERLLAYAEDVDLVVGEAVVYENGETMHGVRTNLEENHIYTGAECAIKQIKAGEWYAGVWRNMYKRQFIIENRLYFAEGILHEDIEYLPRLFLAAKAVKYTKYEFYMYIIRQTSICGTKTSKNLNDLFSIYKNWARLNETICDKKLKKMYKGALTKYFMATCREFKVKNRVYPFGMNGMYLMHNALNFKE